MTFFQRGSLAWLWYSTLIQNVVDEIITALMGMLLTSKPPSCIYLQVLIIQM